LPATLYRSAPASSPASRSFAAVVAGRPPGAMAGVPPRPPPQGGAPGVQQTPHQPAMAPQATFQGYGGPTGFQAAAPVSAPGQVPPGPQGFRPPSPYLPRQPAPTAYIPYQYQQGLQQMPYGLPQSVPPFQAVTTAQNQQYGPLSQ
jgi:hypothetical protein